jgi:TetR/AcrR family transcriptional regulator
MPRPRFYKLSAEKQARILEVATEEFAENGFDKTSYNRIIELAGLSKGAMYYYFDDKTDLYGTVLQAAFGAIMTEMKLPEAEDVEVFWADLEAYYVGFAALAVEQPQMVALSRGLMEHPERWKEGPLAETFAGIMAYVVGLIAHGQRIGAVRTDLDSELLVSVTFGLGEAVDRWSLENIELLTAEGTNVAQQLVGLYRRVLAPKDGDLK